MVDFGEPMGREQAGVRPAVIVSANPLNASRAGVVVVVPCTTTRRGLPGHVELDPDLSGLDSLSYAKAEDVKSVSDQRLMARLGVAPHETMFALGRALQFVLDL